MRPEHEIIGFLCQIVEHPQLKINAPDVDKYIAARDWLRRKEQEAKGGPKIGG